MKAIPRQERPRERFARYGSEAVSTIELLAILLGSGTKNLPIMQLSTQILSHFGSLKNLSEANLRELKQVKGIGTAKALQLQAAFQLLKRFQEEPEKISLRSPQAVYELIRSDLQEKKREVLLLILRDVKRQLIHKEILSQGTLTELLIHPREIFHVAIRHLAHSVIIAHNHPSGDPTPSLRDLDATQKLIHAGKLLGIELMDHLIVGKNCFISLYEKGFFSSGTY